MEKVIEILVLIGILLLTSLVLSLPVYWLWNGCLVDAVTSVQPVTWLQAWGINVLAAFLFKTTVSK